MNNKKVLRIEKPKVKWKQLDYSIVLIQNESGTYSINIAFYNIVKNIKKEEEAQQYFNYLQNEFEKQWENFFLP